MALTPPNETPIQFPPNTNSPIQNSPVTGGIAASTERQRRQFEALQKLMGTGSRSYLVLVNAPGLGLSADLVIQGVYESAAEAPTVSAMLKGIKKVLIPQVKDMAAVLGVRRPTIYAWMEGEQEPTEEHLARIQEIYSLVWGANVIFKDLDTKSLEGALIHGPLVDLLTVQPLPREQVQQQFEAIERQVRQAMHRRAARKQVDLQAFAKHIGQSMRPSLEARLENDIESGKGFQQGDGDL